MKREEQIQIIKDAKKHFENMVMLHSKAADRGRYEKLLLQNLKEQARTHYNILLDDFNTSERVEPPRPIYLDIEVQP